MLLGERAKRTAAKELLAFTSYTFPRYRVGRPHRLIAAKLEQVERGEVDRCMILMPPRHGKSEKASRRFPAWALGRNPRLQIISASYGIDLARDFGRDVRNIVASPEFGDVFPGVALSQDSRAQDRFNTSRNGSYVAAGVGTAVTGRGADILLIDDPFKDRAEAESQARRNTVWDWYTSTAYTRLMPGGRVVLIQTRWHKDDLAGRLLEAQANGGDRWDVLSLPALSDDDEALWPEAYPAAALHRIRDNIGPRDFASLYQQEPRAAEGNLFKTAQIAALDAAPADCAAPVRAWDLASVGATGTGNPDWTVGLKLARRASGQFVVLDVVRLRGDPAEVEAAIVATASRDGRAVRVGLPQDPGQAGKAQVQYLTRKLAGHRVESGPETGAKDVRAAPVVAQANVGNLAVVGAPWNAAFFDELAAFPAGAKDDQVDALSRAFGMLMESRGPMRISPDLLARI